MGTQVMHDLPSLVATPTHLLTLHDVVLDSPVWRSNIQHLEEQIDHCEKWLEAFIRALKQYIDAVIKYNAQTSNLCKRTLPANTSGSLIDPEITGTVIQAFANSLQSELAVKTKLVSDLEETILHPLQRYMKQDWKELKDARKSFERILDKYENQLSRYSVLSKQKEASALREDAFQMYDIRKTYIRTSGEYFTQLISFKACLEELLVGSFSGAIAAQIEENDDLAIAHTQSRTLLPGWRQCLEEWKATYTSQIEFMKKRCHTLEDQFIQRSRPHRSLKRYSTSNNDQMSAVSVSMAQGDRDDKYSGYESPSEYSETDHPKEHPSKQGYLYARIIVGKPARYSWVRRWFFLQDGWFGYCHVSTVNKVKGCVVIGERASIEECEGKIVTDMDRRYSFEIISPQSTFLVQAETDEDMQQWVWALEKCKDMLHKEKRLSRQRSESSVSTTKEHPASVSSVPRSLLYPQPFSLSHHTGNGSSKELTPPFFESLGTAEDTDELNNEENLSYQQSVAFALTALMLQETAVIPEAAEDGKKSNPTEPTETESDTTNGGLEAAQQPQPSSSWSMPWLISGISALSNTVDPTSNGHDQSANPPYATEGGALIIWPNKREIEASNVHLSNYPPELLNRHQELRQLFSHVPSTEVVMDVFVATMYHQPMAEPGVDPDDTATWTSTPPLAKYGYAGDGYLTQSHLWFYSNTLMTCLNTLVVPLEQIKAIRLERALSSPSNGMLMSIDLKTDPVQTFSFGLWLEAAELVSERLKIAVEAAKNSEREDLQVLFESIRNANAGRTKSKRPLSHVTPMSALNAAVTPLTVQAHPQLSNLPTQPAVGSDPAASGNATDGSDSSHSTNRSSPATGALAAAMSAVSGKLATSTTDTASKNIEAKKQAETLATQSEDDWPAGRTKPKTPIECQCADHLDKKEAELTLPISAKRLFTLMFEPSEEKDGQTTVWSKLNQAKGNGEPSITAWSANKDGCPERILKYIMPVSNPMVKAKETEVIETHQILKQEEYLCYVALVTTKTPHLPYADAFVPSVKYCVTYVTPSSCRLRCSIGIKWLKSVVMKGMISKAANKGLSETVNALVPIIKQEAAQASGLAKSLPKDALNEKANANEISDQPPPVLKSDHDTGKLQQALSHLSSIPHWGMTLLLLMAALYIAFSWKSSSNLPTMRQDNNIKIVWRAVYLRDIDDELTGKSIGLDHANAKNYEAFQVSRVSTLAESNYSWYSGQHRLMAAELRYTRERLGALRYELLAAFRMLNGMERRALESEYWNWLLDENIRCQQNDTLKRKTPCEEVQKEISLY
ncbi:uncharacterized protein BYT42DRAFT_589984 [Radiomyces spectabilis]|uniref:uncharacterized protein n=1 Tax=Radiomyces spectabilis TaxID=64574 RepID=UPI00221FDA90|nr:uncharacterized protein BYT42DRAFT_589984 [Radiomyces spectabilis]KAI8364665.1 hypothetical protein BYT42DRAFT_589984 [Radiomyces spectabilis]